RTARPDRAVGTADALVRRRVRLAGPVRTPVAGQGSGRHRDGAAVRRAPGGQLPLRPRADPGQVRAGRGRGQAHRHPIAVVSSPCSGFEPWCRATAEYLRSCGAAVDELRLGELGIHGNGHAMMLEQNNAEVAALITDWIIKHT